MHVPSYGGIIWLKHQEMETRVNVGEVVLYICDLWHSGCGLARAINLEKHSSPTLSNTYMLMPR